MSRTLRTASLAAKLGLVGAALMVIALGSIALTLWVTWQLDGGAASVNEAGRLRMQTWRLAQATATPDSLQRAEQVHQFDASLELLRLGDPERPLFVPADAATRVAFDRVQASWQDVRERWLAGSPEPPAATAQRAEALVQDIDRFVSAIELRLSRWTDLLTMFQLTLMGLAIAAGIALMYAAHLFVFQPLARLQGGLQAVAAGNLGARIEVDSVDEFGRVAAGFNRMAVRLEDLYRGLEAKVADKTLHLHTERNRLHVLYEASRMVAGSASLDELAQGFVQRLRQVAAADAGMLRWNDGDRGQMLLLAHDGVPPAMLASERCVEQGQCHCGQAGRPGAPRTIAIRPIADQNPGSACDRHGFGRVLTLPVRLQDQVLGEIDLLWRGPGHNLGDDDRALLESLASHLASGMEGIRAAALAREAAVSEERGFIARELHDSIAQALAFMKIQVQMLRGALRRHDGTAVEQTVQELDAGVRESLADVRELLLHFRTRSSGDDIAAALKSTLQKFQHQTGIATDLRVQGSSLPLAPDVQVQVLHVVQEALSNVRKHAGATRVRVTLAPEPDWRIDIDDDGCGFAPDTRAADDGHVGLRIMRERAAGIGAAVCLRSTPGQGTRVSLSLPRHEGGAAVAATAAA
jgi:two-component system, NarL family, nitrate/nitrite sensor histidine kinase NarX